MKNESHSTECAELEAAIETGIGLAEMSGVEVTPEMVTALRAEIRAEVRPHVKCPVCSRTVLS